MTDMSTTQDVPLDYELIRAIVRGVVEAVMAEGPRQPARRPQVPRAPPTFAALPGLADALAALRGEAGARDPAGRRYVTQGAVLLALGVLQEEHQRHALRLGGELRALGWTSGPRVRPRGPGGPRVVPYYPPQG